MSKDNHSGFNLYDGKGLWGRGSDLGDLLQRAADAGITDFTVHPTYNDKTYYGETAASNDCAGLYVNPAYAR